MRRRQQGLSRGQGLRLELRPDERKFKEREDSIGFCRRCGARLILLPDDRRQGYCFDCLDLLDLGA